MSRAVDRVGGIVIPAGAYRPHYLAISAFTDIGQGSGLAMTSGARPFLAVITAGVMAHEDAGINFTGTDWAWMESWVFIGILAALFVLFWVMDRAGKSDVIRPAGRPMEKAPTYPFFCAAAGALLLVGSRRRGDEKYEGLRVLR